MTKIPEIHAVIMAGGRGERFWPFSRQNLPKQFLPLSGKKPLLAETVDRLKGWIPPLRTWVVTNDRHVSLVKKLCPRLKPSRIVGEPAGKDTAPCIATAAVLIARQNPKAVMVVLPSDHWIAPVEKFQQVLKDAGDLAYHREVIVTLGIRPQSPHTGYGYIHARDRIPFAGKTPFFRVNAFKEKPDSTTAKKYLKQGGFFWNSGIFVWRADTILEDLKAYRPGIWKTARAIAAAKGGLQAALRRHYLKFEKISIDYAVLEKAQNTVMAAAPFEWDDLGSWSSLAKRAPSDQHANTIVGDAISLDSRGCTLVGQKTLVAALGVSNLIVVATPGATLVTTRDKEQEVKKLVALLRNRPGGARLL